MPAPSRPVRPVAETRRRWAAALLLTLLWHVLVALGMGLIDPFAADAGSEPRPPIELTFAPLAPPSTRETPPDARDEPEFFTELPEDRADLEPERADALSNVDSRARDTVTEGETTDLPRMEGRGDAPQVGLQPSSPVAEEEGAGDPRAEDGEQVEPIAEPEPAERDETDGDPEADRRGERAVLGESVEAGRTGRGAETETDPLRSALGDPRASLRPGRISASPEPRFLVGRGRDSIYQEEMDNRLGNVPLFGDISLNTVAWNWAPWLQRFAREFHRTWVPPYAYWIGLIEGGQLVEVEIDRDGTLLRLEVKEEEGHESLREATLGNFRSIAPYQPLPEDFPEPTLRLTVRVTYPGRD